VIFALLHETSFRGNDKALHGFSKNGKLLITKQKYERGRTLSAQRRLNDTDVDKSQSTEDRSPPHSSSQYFRTVACHIHLPWCMRLHRFPTI